MAERSDLELLEELLALEERLIATYEAGLRRDAIEPAFAQGLLEQEREHAAALERALPEGGRRNPRASVPLPELGGALRSRSAFAQLAAGLEAEALAAYVDAAATVRDARLRQPLGSIMACEAAHEVALRHVAGARLILQ